jgi:ABC-2 type transport system permease protein/sodium transport system permease protein
MNDIASTAKSPVRRLSGFSLARQWRLTAKELAETLRDRRTIVTLLVMPLLVYPLLSIIFRQFLTVSLAKPGQSTWIIGVDDERQGELVTHWLAKGDEKLRSLAASRRNDIEPPLVEEPQGNRVVMDIGSAEEKLKAGRIDVAIKLLSPDQASPEKAAVEIIYHQHSAAAMGLRSFIERRIRAFNLIARDKSEGPLPNDGVVLQHQVLPTPEATSRSLLPAVIPLVLLMMTITGAVYPAIDLTAGERERGTLEALIAAPVSRLGVLMAKYVAVLVVALLTAGMNLIAMSLTIYSAGLLGVLVGTDQSPALLAAAVFGLLLLFASFFSAVLLVITSFAKSFKEAQAYLIPLMLITLAPGLLTLSPSMALSLPLAVTPLVNVVLLARDVFAGAATLPTTIVVVLSTLFYAAAAIALAARIFGSDAMLYGSGGSWSDLFRRPRHPLESPSLVAAMFCLAAVFAAAINLGGAGSLLAASAGFSVQIVVSGLMTLLTFAAIPLAAALAENVRLPAAFRLHGPSIRSGLAAVLLGLSLGVLVSELTVLLLQFGVTAISLELKDVIQKKAAELNTLPLPLVLIALGIIPALAEEFFFRGYLFRALAGQWGSTATIVATAVTFAAFHAFGVAGITLERLLPSLLMGLVLGSIAWQSGSVWPGIALHAINNALLLLIARYKDQMVERHWIAGESEHLPPLWLAAAAGLAAVGTLLLLWPRTLAKPLSQAQTA